MSGNPGCSTSQINDDIIAQMAQLDLSPPTPPPSQPSPEQVQVLPWVLWVYHHTTEHPQHAHHTPGCQHIAHVNTFIQLVLELLNNPVENLPSQIGSGYHFVKQGITPLRIHDLRGTGFINVIVTHPSVSLGRIGQLWNALTTQMLHAWSSHSFFPSDGPEAGWSGVIPYVNGAGIERLSNNQFVINVWTSVESSLGVDVRNWIIFMMTELSNEILLTESYHIWVPRPYFLNLSYC